MVVGDLRRLSSSCYLSAVKRSGRPQHHALLHWTAVEPLASTGGFHFGCDAHFGGLSFRGVVAGRWWPVPTRAFPWTGR